MSPSAAGGKFFGGVVKDELPIIQKTFDMLVWLIPKIDQFPRKQKFLLGERIERTALDFLALLQKAKFETKRKKSTLMDAHVTFEHFKTLVRLSVALHLITTRHYEYLSKYIVEIGKMLGGWMKSKDMNRDSHDERIDRIDNRGSSCNPDNPGSSI